MLLGRERSSAMAGSPPIVPTPLIALHAKSLEVLMAAMNRRASRCFSIAFGLFALLLAAPSLASPPPNLLLNDYDGNIASTQVDPVVCSTGPWVVAAWTDIQTL